MSRKRIIWTIILLAAAGAGLYAYKEYTRTHKDLANMRPDFVITARQLIGEYESNDSAAARKFNGQVLEVNGIVKIAESDEKGFYTVVLSNGDGLSSVRCSMDTVHSQDASGLRPGSSTTVRGICTGFNKDELGLGSDVILNRCAIIIKKK